MPETAEREPDGTSVVRGRNRSLAAAWVMVAWAGGRRVAGGFGPALAVPGRSQDDEMVSSDPS